MTDRQPNPAGPASIEALRQEIDRLDTEVHDLIMRRADLVRRIGEAKQAGDPAAGAGYFRPAREAAVLRRLMARHHGPLSKVAMLRLWRELMGAMLCLQGPFQVAVLAHARWPGLWTLAHDHFGSQATIMTVDSAGAVLRAVAEGQAGAGVLPLPAGDDADPWWPFLFQEGPKAPRVAARLPFGPAQVMRGGTVEALVVGRVAAQPTGHDRTLIGFETAGKVSHDGLTTALKGVGFGMTTAFALKDKRGGWVLLAEVDGFVDAKDARLVGLEKLQNEPILHSWLLGGYAEPFTADDMAMTD